MANRKKSEKAPSLFMNTNKAVFPKMSTLDEERKDGLAATK